MDLSRPEISRRIARAIQSVASVDERQRWRREAEKAPDWAAFCKAVGIQPDDYLNG
jgi:hypothetical protein